MIVRSWRLIEQPHLITTELLKCPIKQQAAQPLGNTTKKLDVLSSLPPPPQESSVTFS